MRPRAPHGLFWLSRARLARDPNAGPQGPRPGAQASPGTPVSPPWPSRRRDARARGPRCPGRGWARGAGTRWGTRPGGARRPRPAPPRCPARLPSARPAPPRRAGRRGAAGRGDWAGPASARGPGSQVLTARRSRPGLRPPVHMAAGGHRAAPWAPLPAAPGPPDSGATERAPRAGLARPGLPQPRPASRRERPPPAPSPAPRQPGPRAAAAAFGGGSPRSAPSRAHTRGARAAGPACGPGAPRAP